MTWRESSDDRVGAERVLKVERAGPLTTVQDLGRPGFAHLGVPRSGAADRSSLRLANRLVGNREAAAALEVTVGGLHAVPLVDVVVALTGADCPLAIAGVPAPRHTVLHVERGTPIQVGTARAGLRAYLAIRGAFTTDVVLGSRSTDTLSGLGPPVVRDGDRLPIGGWDGPDVAGWPSVDVAAVPGVLGREGTARAGTGRESTGREGTGRFGTGRAGTGRTIVLDAGWGPRADWFTAEARELLRGSTWVVAAQSNRVGLRLEGPALERLLPGELPSEGLVRGAVQVPPSGLPVVFLADHPVTGGYPVLAVLRDAEVDRAAQLAPGARLGLRLSPL